MNRNGWTDDQRFSSGLFVVNNQTHARQRQRFSWCYEYAHILLDRDAVA